MAIFFRYVFCPFFCVVNIWVLMFKKQKLHTAILSALAASSVAAPAAFAEIEEVVVTATKRAASTQDIPVAVQALDESTLDDFNINNFSDYLIQLPGITAGGSGPGQNTIYIRGVASTTPNLTTAGVAGLAPNVALYLDEQPLSQPGRNLDVYTADMARVEVLSGPQGTLFGASSQAGTVRLITNKPDPSGQYANVKIGTEFTKDGEMSNNVEGMVNLPIMTSSPSEAWSTSTSRVATSTTSPALAMPRKALVSDRKARYEATAFPYPQAERAFSLPQI